MISNDRWRNNWLAIRPPGAVRIDLERSGARRLAVERTIRDLQPGTPVVVCASAPGAVRRCRRFAAGTGIELDRAYLAFPSAAAPAYLVEDDAAPMQVFVETVLAAPPRTRFSLPISAGLSLLRVVKPWGLLRLLAPGRVVIGRRT
jgi:hypothetical protein